MDIRILIADIETEYASLEASLSTPEITADPKQLMTLGRRKAELDMLMVPINELKTLENCFLETSDFSLIGMKKSSLPS